MGRTSKESEEERKRREFYESYARTLEATGGEEVDSITFRKKMRELNDKKPLNPKND